MLLLNAQPKRQQLEQRYFNTSHVVIKLFCTLYAIFEIRLSGNILAPIFAIFMSSPGMI